MMTYDTHQSNHLITPTLIVPNRLYLGLINIFILKIDQEGMQLCHNGNNAFALANLNNGDQQLEIEEFTLRHR
jgi:hypothetical protein